MGVFHASIAPTIWRRCSGSSTQCISDQTPNRLAAAAAVHVDHDVGLGDQEARDEVGELLVDRARSAEPGNERLKFAPDGHSRVFACEASSEAHGITISRPCDVVGIGLAREAQRGHLPLGLVAVHAAEDEHGRPVAAVDGHDRDEKVRPAARVRRPRHLEAPELLAGCFEVERAVHGRVGHGARL